MKCIYLKDAQYIDHFKVFLRFNDGKSGEVDLKDIVHKHAVAAPLRKPEAFARFYLDSWPTLAWDCGFDVAPEKLYDMCEPQATPDHNSSALRCSG